MEWLADYMMKHDFSVSIIHGEQTAEERKQVMKVYLSLYIYIHILSIIKHRLLKIELFCLHGQLAGNVFLTSEGQVGDE